MQNAAPNVPHLTHFEFGTLTPDTFKDAGFSVALKHTEHSTDIELLGAPNLIERLRFYRFYRYCREQHYLAYYRKPELSSLARGLRWCDTSRKETL